MKIWPQLSNSSESLAIGFVTYRPDSSFYDRVAQTCGLGHEVFVFDNAPEAFDHGRLDPEQPKLHYATGGKNLGLGVGLSLVCASAYSRGCKYLLFFDQDTRFTRDTLRHAGDLLLRESGGLAHSHAVVTFQAPRGDGTDHQIIDELLTISSGSLFLLDNVAQIGWHNSRYFVDGVDYEFCLRARWSKFRVARCSGAPGFDHVTDQADSTSTLFGREMRLRKYPAWRVGDSLRAYVRLALTCLGQLDFRSFVSVVRSLMIFVGGQVLARLMLRGSK